LSLIKVLVSSRKIRNFHALNKTPPSIQSLLLIENSSFYDDFQGSLQDQHKPK